MRSVAEAGDEPVRSSSERWDAENRCIAAPALLLSEVDNVLYPHQRVVMMHRAAVRLAVKAALSLPLRLYGKPESRARVLDLVERLTLHAVYHARHLALTEWLGADFWAADGGLARAVQDT